MDITHDADRSVGVSLSLQVLFRIVVTLSAAGLGCWGWWRLPGVRSLMINHRGWLFMLLAIGTFLAVPTSDEPLVSLFVAFSSLAYMLLCLTCLCLFGLKRLLLDSMWAIWLFVVISWWLYLLVPEIGVHIEFLSITQSVERMGGLGHPNTLGRNVCLGMLMIVVAVHKRWIPWYYLVAGLPIFVATLIESKSRTPVVALVASIVFFGLPLLKERSTFLLIALAIAVGLAGMVLVEACGGLDRVSNSALRKVAKSGELSEITSATGRTEIWSEAWAKIVDRPLFGYGGGTSGRVMKEHSGHAHNLILEMLLLFGFPTTLLLMCLLVLNVRDVMRKDCAMLPEILVFILILGLVESPLFGMVPDPLMCVWLLCIFGTVIERSQRAATVAGNRVNEYDTRGSVLPV